MRVGIGAALSMAIVQYVFAIAFVFIFAFIINALAPTFGAEKNFNQALKVTAYAPTASWIAGIFMLIPMLGILTLVGAVYSLYLLFVGLPKIMKPAEDKGTVYTIVAIVVAIIAGFIINAAAQSFMPKPSVSDLFSGRSGQIERHANMMEEAAERGDFATMMGAATAMMGGDPNAPIVDSAALRDLAPSRIAGLSRGSVEVETLTAPVKAVVMTADYGGGDRHVTLRITNSPMISAMTGFAGFAGAEYDRSTDNGYERVRRDGDSMIVEEWDKSAKRGRYGRSIGGSFLVEANGEGVSIKDLEKAVREFSERKLESLPAAK
jgi:hypothetical protein